MSRFRSISIMLLVALLAIGVRADSGPGGGGSGGGDGGGNSSGGHKGNEKRSPRSHDGAYDVMISGYYKGQGTANVSAASVTITAQVTVNGGETVTFQSESLTVAGPYFSGAGTVGGKKVTIKGRLDAARLSRLVATFKSDVDNHRGRIAGTLPNDPPDDKWDDHGGGGGDGGGPGPTSGGDGGGKS